MSTEKPIDNPVIQSILTRSSIRAFTQEPVSGDQVEAVLRAAMSAPSALNKQPWAFVVIRSRAVLDELASRLPNAKMTADAPIAFVICGDMTKRLPDEAGGYWIQDATAALENLLLAVHALGLGAVWTGVYPKSDRVAVLREVLCLPDHIMPFALIPAGHPAAPAAPKNKWNPENIHTDRW